MTVFNKDMTTGFADGVAWWTAIMALYADLVLLNNSPHRVADAANVCAVADATDQATAYALANDLKAKYNLHRAVVGAHLAADGTNVVAADDADTVARLVTLSNEIKADFNLHLANVAHPQVDNLHAIAAADAGGADDAARIASAIVLLNEAKAKYNAHLAKARAVTLAVQG